MTPGLRSWSVRLVAVGTAAMLIADAWFLVLDLTGGYQAGHPVDAGWIVWYGLTAAAVWHPLAPGETGEAALARADAALYEAKHSGRNRTVLAASPERTDAKVRTPTARRVQPREPRPLART